MDDKKLLGQIGTLIDGKLEPIKGELSGIKQQLNTVEMKVELVNGTVSQLSKKIDKSQEETIDALSELIQEGYNSHEKRIKKLEERLPSPQTQ